MEQHKQQGQRYHGEHGRSISSEVVQHLDVNLILKNRVQNLASNRCCNQRFYPLIIAICPLQFIKNRPSLAARFTVRPKRHCDSGSLALRLSFHHVAFRAKSQCGYYQTA